jgi:hypothetical protein
VAFEANEAVPGSGIAFTCKLIPSLNMTDIVDPEVVMLAPEQRNGVEFLTMSERARASGMTAVVYSGIGRMTAQIDLMLIPSFPSIQTD